MHGGTASATVMAHWACAGDVKSNMHERGGTMVGRFCKCFDLSADTALSRSNFLSEFSGVDVKDSQESFLNL
ncbi:hypothetical protein SISSUDRAFT_395548 [Sistotremastrum suecicum HHB10207 ss-3]|uniref:Uncharacterized protein n=1 Tax=Sistotremastrum suecicum HHB10207 ss-3 TaxID=1314776 RepID=A0A165YV01_9AGAM|nr:hypothetical protein SISSUDRAFT_395548 [Sistotremastrum suecicum HHB10207 ss-3]